MSLYSINKLNKMLLDWNLSDKAQRFGQFVESNSDWIVGQELYESFDSFYVYSEIITRIENGYLV